jgi:hypothetical protein
MKILNDDVFFDGASAYRWEELNETEFLGLFFRHLRFQLGRQHQQYQFFLLSSHDPDIVPQSASFDGKRKVLFFISDESGSVPWRLSSDYFAVFKCYLPREFRNTNIFPFNLGYVRGVPYHDPKPVNLRSTNVFFSGALHTNREVFFREIYAPDETTALNGKISSSYVQFTNRFKGGLSQKEYGDLLSDSKIALCPKGFQSSETFRHIEALRAGAIVVSEPLPNTLFYRGSPILVVTDWASGLEKIRAILEDSAILQELQYRTIFWWQDVCSEEATARYVLEKLVHLEETA